jgi:Ser/Thr protein kinase RdoA (MazF antagonist)
MSQIIRRGCAIRVSSRPLRQVASARVPQAHAEVLARDVRRILDRRFPRHRITEVREIDGGTQAGVWRVTLDGLSPLELAVRIVSRPLDLLERQAAALRRTESGVRTSRILATEELRSPDGSRRCIQVTEWLPGEHPRRASLAQARAIGSALGRLHQALRGDERSFADRPLTLDSYRGYVDQLRSAGDRARALLDPVESHQRPLREWDECYQELLPRQLIHGDLHAANILVDGHDVAFIDFDKLMVGPRVFDLAKFISTSCFQGTRKARLARGTVDALLAGYDSVAGLRGIERASLRALCVILNAESALCGLNYDVPHLVQGAHRAGTWWITTGCSSPPAALPRLRRPARRANQLALFSASGDVNGARSEP